MPNKFTDYYEILQVHHDASPQVIKAAFRKLCTMYHPDSSKNENEMKRMMLINEAYSILGNAEKRKVYQRQWLENKGRDKHVFSVVHPSMQNAFDSGKNVLDKFFHALFTKNWEDAYSCLTLEDQERISLSDFTEWKTAVNNCFDMQDYRINHYRSYDKCRIGEYIYEKVSEYAVIISDLDLQTSHISKNTTHKYVAFDGTSWKVCLGMKSLKEATIKFKLLAERRENFDPVTLYRSAVTKRDPLTGLLSETGFFDEALKEVERKKRYHNPFSLIAFQIHCDNSEREMACLCQCASIIKSCCRLTDIAARFGNHQIVCLLAETREKQALFAANKFIDNIRQRQTEPYTINAGIIEYRGRTSIEDAVFSACSNASVTNNCISINRSESF